MNFPVPSASHLLHIWELCLSQQPCDQALTILHAVFPDVSRDEISQLSIGERDAVLLTLRHALFGNTVKSTSSCPSCNELMEWDTCVTDLILQTSNRSLYDLVAELKNPKYHNVRYKKYKVEFRLPNSADLIAINTENNVKSAQQQLLQRCVHKIKLGAKTLKLNKVPERITHEISAQMELADPQANMNIELNCDNCQHNWSAMFDIVYFIWNEINVWAKQTLRLIHTLAINYGWSEHEVLSMTALRRQMYLEMLCS